MKLFSFNSDSGKFGSRRDQSAKQTSEPCLPPSPIETVRTETESTLRSSTRKVQRRSSDSIDGSLFGNHFTGDGRRCSYRPYVGGCAADAYEAAKFDYYLRQSDDRDYINLNEFEEEI